MYMCSYCNTGCYVTYMYVYDCNQPHSITTFDYVLTSPVSEYYNAGHEILCNENNVIYAVVSLALVYSVQS